MRCPVSVVQAVAGLSDAQKVEAIAVAIALDEPLLEGIAKVQTCAAQLAVGTLTREQRAEAAQHLRWLAKMIDDAEDHRPN